MAALLTIPLLAAAPARADGWKLDLTAYGWGAQPNGNPYFNDNTTVFDETLDPVAGGGFVRLRAEKSRWSIFSEMTWPDLHNPRFGSRELGRASSLRSLELGGGYRVSEHFELYLGARRTRVWTFLRFSYRYIFTNEFETEYTEPFIGGRWSVPLRDRWGFEGRADVGGFDVGSELTWNAELLARYDAGRRWSLLAGYRVMEVDAARRSDRVYFDNQLPGAVLGLRFHLLEPTERPDRRPTDLADRDPRSEADGDAEAMMSAGPWRPALAAYGWGAGLQGNARFSEDPRGIFDGLLVDESSDVGDVDDPFSGSGLVRLELSNGRWDVFFESAFFEDTGRPSITVITARQRHFELTGGYRVGKDLALLLGVRRTELEADVDGRSITPSYVSRSDWTDLLVGGRWTPRLGRRWSLEARADVAGFGFAPSSELTWNLETLLRFEVHRRASLVAGFRVLDVDYEDRKPPAIPYLDRWASRVVWEIQQPGAVAGLRVAF